MAILDEIRSGILENSELDGNEKICLVAMLCGSDMASLQELSTLMGVTYNTAQMTVRSLRLKGFLKDSTLIADDAEVSALRKLLEREKMLQADSSEKCEDTPPERVRSVFSKKEDSFSDEAEELYKKLNASSKKDQQSRMLELSKALDLDVKTPGHAMKTKAASLYKKDSAVAKAAKQMKEIGFEKEPARESVRRRAKAEEHTPEAPAAGASASDYISPEDRVMALIDESITRSEAAIILGFAGGDYDKVETTYRRIRGTQIKDKVDALVKLLQAEP